MVGGFDLQYGFIIIKVHGGLQFRREPMKCHWFIDRTGVKINSVPLLKVSGGRNEQSQSVAKLTGSKHPSPPFADSTQVIGFPCAKVQYVASTG